MVDALRQIHRSLVPGGVLLDMRPGPTDSVVLAGGEAVGFLDESEFWRETEETDAALLAAVRERLFASEAEVRFDVVHRFESAALLLESAALLLEEVGGWRSTRIPDDVVNGLGPGRPPFEVVEPCALQRLRAL